MPDPLPPHEAQRLRLMASRAALTVATVLILTKLAGYFITGSVSLLSSLIDSATDLLASLVVFIGVREAEKPADSQHRFGHGKAEPLAALGEAAFVAAPMLFLVVEAFRRLHAPQAVQAPEVGIGVMAVSLSLTLLLVLFQGYVVRRTASVAISADHWHYLSDLLTNAAIIAVIFLSGNGQMPILDPLLGLGIAAFVIWGLAKVVQSAFDQLMDHELPAAQRERIAHLACAQEGAQAVHDLRTRMAGATTFIELHLEMDAQIPLREAHAIGDRVEAAIRREFPGAEILIHQDPVEPGRPSDARQHFQTEDAVERVPAALQDPMKAGGN